MAIVIYPKCIEYKECFARRFGKCTILTQSYPPGTCPFQKERREITDGKRYPLQWDNVREKA